MNREEALHIVKQQMHEKRYIHTIGVMETAIELAKLYGVDEKRLKLQLYSMIMRSVERFQRWKRSLKVKICRKIYFVITRVMACTCWGSRKKVGITDPEILQAITYHTSGHEKMTMLDKVIYVADYIELGESFGEEARKLAYADINQALLFALKRTIQFLMEKIKRFIH